MKKPDVSGFAISAEKPNAAQGNDIGPTGHFSWFGAMNPRERRTFWGCFSGWMLDAMDVQIYAVLIPTLLTLWHLTKGQAGALGTSALIVSSVGGWVAGVLSDRFGRLRMLQITVVWFAVFSLLCAFCQSYTQLFIARSLEGLGFGGEWVAGAALMAETIRPEFRGRAVGMVASSYSIGYAVATLAGTVLLLMLPADMAWRAMFVVGALPALLVIFVRRHVEESHLFEAAKRDKIQISSFLEIFSGRMIRYTLLSALLSAGALGGNYVMLTWLPTYLKLSRHLSIGNTGLYLAFNIAGSFAGHVVSAHLSDAIGRKRTFLLMSSCSILIVMAYMLLPLTPTMVLLTGIPLGFFTSGIITNIGAWFAEFFPTRMRGSGQGFCYNFGRGIGALAPAIVGFASEKMDLSVAMAACAGGAYFIVFLCALMLPDTRGEALET